MNMPNKMRAGFNWDEALFLAHLSKQVYEFFQQKKNIEGTELKNLYNILYPSPEWTLVHIINNPDTNIRGIILKKNTEHHYAIAFRGSILTDEGMLEMTDIFTDIQWDLVKYSPTTSPKIRAVEGFLHAYSSVATSIRLFFKTLAGQIDPSDLENIKQLSPQERLSCIGAIADAGAVRLGADFAANIRESIFQSLKNDGIGSSNGYGGKLNIGESLVNLSPSSDHLDVYITGHSLGGCLAHFCALDLALTIKNSRVIPKIYTFGTPKIGNPAFADYYNQHIPKEWNNRVENALDTTPNSPFPLPFPLNMLVGNGIRVGDLYIGEYAPVGEAHTVVGLGSQGVSLNFGGALEFLGGIPFPHSFDTYIQLLEEQQQLWQELLRPIKSVMMDLMGQLLEEQTGDLETDFHTEIKEVQSAIDDLQNELKFIQRPDAERPVETDCTEELALALPGLKPDLVTKLASQVRQTYYEPGSIIVRQGESANKFYAIAQGQVEVLINLPNGTSKVVREMSPGEYFGEIGLLSGGIRTATVRAKTDSRVKVLSFDRETFKQMISESEVTATQLAYSMASRVITD